MVTVLLMHWYVIWLSKKCRGSPHRNVTKKMWKKLTTVEKTMVAMTNRRWLLRMTTRRKNSPRESLRKTCVRR